jgi:hypothetical protein
MDGPVVPLHRALQVAFVGDGRGFEPIGVQAELGQSAGGFLGAGTCEDAVAVGVGQVGQTFAAGEGLLAFDLGAEPCGVPLVGHTV